jgi:hypothetical protein
VPIIVNWPTPPVGDVAKDSLLYLFQERLYSPSGRAVPTVFELRVDGVILAEQTFFYFASYSGGPPPEIRP